MVNQGALLHVLQKFAKRFRSLRAVAVCYTCHNGNSITNINKDNLKGSNFLFLFYGLMFKLSNISAI